ncbi:hypothetical protein A3L09_08120 [Thermococcus profundus]|uniref:DUF340 domain-containing protein n=1 Tax=Thermococcus profundus TaxID=49899 RepID=A0A2Z2MLC0_THEPR|nr:hypothetical protein [Thermococcus profundus]ASJ03221.1 hypothetical protein A3L09_08120 [Thermococcus profundus]
MNVLIPLIVGLGLGYLLQKVHLIGRPGRKALELSISISVLLLVFLMGVNFAETGIDVGDVTIVSTVFAILTSAGSLILAILLWGWEK